MTEAARILVVDDDPNVRKTLADILRVKGYGVAVAASGAEGIAEAARALVDVALIDLKLPDMSGIEVMEKIKAASPLTEAIILTGHAALDTAVEATNKGAFSYLLKPYQIEELLQHIRRALERQQAQQEIRRQASFSAMNPFPVLEVDPDGKLTYLNPAAARLFPALSLMRPVGKVLGPLPQDGGDGRRQEVVRELESGTVTFEQHLFPVPDSDRTRVYLMDITERKVHESELKRFNQLLLAIRSINEYLLIAENEEALFRFVCNVLQTFDGFVGVMVGLKAADYVLQPVAWAGLDTELVSRLSLRWDDTPGGAGVMGRAARDSQMAVIDDVADEVVDLACQEIYRSLQIRSAAAVPLVSEGETLGVLAIYADEARAFDAQTREFMAEVASNISIGVRTLRLDKDLHTTLNHLRSSMNSTVEAIAGMVELRDPYTAGHERRVAQLASAIGTEMHLPERQIEGLYVIGFLHDIGKIAVPAEILSKPTKLLDIEVTMVRSHSQAGYEILKNLEFPWPVAQAVLQHHERLDGGGYPKGLKGGDIILEARILMVADVVEAMASHRPYRSAIGLDEALQEIRANRGSLYDGEVVDACLNLFSEGDFKFDSSF